MAKNYWAERQARIQEKLTTKNIKETEEQLKKYYSRSMKKVISEFEATYDKLQATIADGREPTPADLYKLDKYWEMQGQLKKELQKLGDKQHELMSKQFEQQYLEIYEGIALQGSPAFSTMNSEMAKQAINTIWCADGKNWSQRIWGNTEKLQQVLNDSLVECVVTGKKTTELKKLLIEKFNVSYSSADMLVRTEMAHIQTQAAQQRYQDYGIEKVEVWVDEDEKTCPICAKHEGEQHLITEKMPVPFHPRCRCCMIPVIEEKEETLKCEYCGKPIEQGTYCEECKEKAFNYLYKADDGKFKTPEWFMKRGATVDDVVRTHFESWSMPSERAAYRGYMKNLDEEMAALKGVNKNKYYKLKHERDKWFSDYDTAWYPQAYNAKEEAKMINNFQYCKDCGKPYKVEGKNNRSERCPECYAIYRRKYKAQKERERRAKKKNK